MSELDPSQVRARVVEGPPVEIPASEQLVFDKQDLVEENFSGREPAIFDSIRSRFRRCRFERMRIGGKEFVPSFGSQGRSEYIDCSFDGSYIFNPLGQARFIRCSFRDVHLKRWVAEDAFEFVDCVFSGLGEELIFYGTRERLAGFGRSLLGERLGYARNEFHGNDFSGMDLRDVEFRRGIDLTKQTLPTDGDHVVLMDPRAALERVRAQVEVWDDEEEREEARFWLETESARIGKGQEQLYFRTSDRETAVARRLFGLLAAAE